MDILLVEDNEILAKGLIYSLNQSKFQVIHKTNVKDTIEFLYNGRPDIIILDISLPDGNGFDLYEKNIKEKQIPTIFLTAKDDEDDIVKGLELGADDYLTKPFSVKELIARINKIVPRDNIIDKIWEWTGNDVNDNTVTVYLKRIREKLDSNIIKTVKGIGYRIDKEWINGK